MRNDLKCAKTNVEPRSRFSVLVGFFGLLIVMTFVPSAVPAEGPGELRDSIRNLTRPVMESVRTDIRPNLNTIRDAAAPVEETDVKDSREKKTVHPLQIRMAAKLLASNDMNRQRTVSRCCSRYLMIVILLCAWMVTICNPPAADAQGLGRLRRSIRNLTRPVIRTVRTVIRPTLNITRGEAGPVTELHADTVAAPLDTAAWTNHHRVSSLKGSLNPSERQPVNRKTREFHFHGERDLVVPPGLIERYRQKTSLANVHFHTVSRFDHQCCWVRGWQNLLSMVRE